jgi:hypothetical protein
MAVDMPGGVNVLNSALWYVVFAAWFFVFIVPVSSFAPWERLRAGTRRVQMKDKKKKTKSRRSLSRRPFTFPLGMTIFVFFPCDF